MTQYERSAATLELPAVLAMLEREAVSDLAKARAAALTPSTDEAEVRRRLAETSAARSMMVTRGSPSFSGVRDVRASLQRADMGGVLNTRELMDIAGVLAAARGAKAYAAGDGKGEKIFNPQTIVYLEEGASIQMDTVQIRGIDSTKRYTKIVVGAGGEAVITEKLLTLTRLDTAPAAAAVPVDVGAVVERVEHMLTPLARAVEVELELRLQPGCLIAATEDELYQIAFNLMENAVKYNLPGGKVYVTLQGDARQVRLRVEDTGVGIPEEDLPKIFDRFYRVDKARSRAAGGTGLGLSIVWDTVRRYGGTVTARRREPEGTCFKVVFPRLAEKGGTQR